MQAVNSTTLKLDLSDLQAIEQYFNDDTTYMDAFQSLKIRSNLTYGGSIEKGFVNIDADADVKERYGDLIKHLEDALRKHNS